MRLVTLPLLHRARVNRLGDLCFGGRQHRAFLLMRLKAGIIPWQITIIEQFSYLILLISYKALIIQGVDKSRQSVPPVRHQIEIEIEVFAKVGQVFGIRMVLYYGREQEV